MTTPNPHAWNEAIQSMAATPNPEPELTPGYIEEQHEDGKPHGVSCCCVTCIKARQVGNDVFKEAVAYGLKPVEAYEHAFQAVASAVLASRSPVSEEKAREFIERIWESALAGNVLLTHKEQVDLALDDMIKSFPMTSGVSEEKAREMAKDLVLAYQKAYDTEYADISAECRAAQEDEPHLPMPPGEYEGWEQMAIEAGVKAVAEILLSSSASNGISEEKVRAMEDALRVIETMCGTQGDTLLGAKLIAHNALALPSSSVTQAPGWVDLKEHPSTQPREPHEVRYWVGRQEGRMRPSVLTHWRPLPAPASPEAAVDGKKPCLCGVHNDPGATTCRACGVILAREGQPVTVEGKSAHEIYRARVPEHCVKIVNFGRHVAGLADVEKAAVERALRPLEGLSAEHAKEKIDNLSGSLMNVIQEDEAELSALRSAMKEKEEKHQAALGALRSCKMFLYADPDHEGENIMRYDFDEGLVAAALAMEGKES